MIAVISDVHFPSNAERQKIMETGLKKLTGIRALFICGDFTDNRKDTKPEEEMKLPEYIKKLPYPVFFIDGNHEDYDVLINGLMNGFSIKNIDNFIITKDITSINIMKKKDIIKNECIKCGKCISICPEGVNPLSLRNKDKCIDCGLCSYICPCNINLRERLR